jgi:hypothetical protein
VLPRTRSSSVTYGQLGGEHAGRAAHEGVLQPVDRAALGKPGCEDRANMASTARGDGEPSGSSSCR